MSNKFQLSTNTQAAADFWTQGGSTVLAAPGQGNSGTGVSAPPPPARSPMKKIHRLLRGRYPLAITLAAICGLGGAAVGFLAVPPKFESTGLVNINPTIVGAGLTDALIPMVNMYIQGQIGLITSPAVADLAMKDQAFVDAWRAAYGSQPLPAVPDFVNAIDIEHKANGPLIRVTFADRNRNVAQTGARAVLASYMLRHANGDDFLDVNKKLEFNHLDLESRNVELETNKNTLRELARKFGTTDLTERDRAVQENLDRYETELSQAKGAYEIARSAADGKPVLTSKPDPEFVYRKIADLPNQQMASDLAYREEAQLNLGNLLATYGPNHPATRRAQQTVISAQQRVQDFAHEFLNANQNKLDMLSLEPANGANLEALKQNQSRLEKTVQDLRAQAADIGSQRRQIEETQAEITRINAQRAVDQRNINELEATRTLTKTVVVFDPGSEPQLSGDKRKLAAGVGLFFGGLFPIGLLMLYGLRENKFRFSDDANSTDLAGVTLLGILPNLPDRLSDPQQAGIAAHCVHQIRTMLQISRHNDEPQVLSITSASAGDGKTSLTLALGLSYAACGARTLLIDCDLVAAGLTHRLNVSSPDGVLEAVANRALLEYVRTTDIADVAILPVGTTHAHHASTLSPVALRRLLSEARKHFDIVIVDTGPILGSIEASLVCAAADRTILAVARNQQRPLVEKSIEHLNSIGSNLAGVVFNRAQANDFAKSMSGVGLRSRVPDGQPPRGGPGASASQAAAANAVAGSFKRAG